MAKATKSSKGVSDASSIAHAEWDFRRCRDKLVYFCWSYEFARQMAREEPDFLDQMKAARVKKIEMKGNRHYELQGADDDQGRCFFEIIDAPPGFPTEPYLSLNHKPTRHSYHPFRRGYPFIVRKYPIREVYFDGRGFHMGELAVERNLLPYDFYSLDIDWSASPKALTKAFQNWIKMRRPIPAKERRGVPLMEIYRADLKALGAYRLMGHFKSDEEALRYTAALDPTKQGLFPNLRQWSRAKRRVEEILQEWKEGLSPERLKESSRGHIFNPRGLLLWPHANPQKTTC